MTDFPALVRAARELPGPATHDRLWAAWFALPLWHFIKAPSPAGWLPHALVVNGERCTLAFTEAARADGYSRMARLPIDPRVASPVMSLAPEDAMKLLPHLRPWNVTGLLVDVGADQFYAPFHVLYGMYHRFRVAPPGARPPPPAAAPAPASRPVPAPVGRGLSIDGLLALPVWHVVTTREDPGFPDFAFRETELVAQVYSSAAKVARLAGSPPTAVMAPRALLALLTDLELCGYVRFDDELEVQLVDVALHGR